MSQGERLVVKTIVDCSNCDGSGLWHDGTACGDCGGRGWVESHRSPTPADLLTDPRVRALVKAAQRSVKDMWESHELETALALFEEVGRG